MPEVPSCSFSASSSGDTRPRLSHSLTVSPRCTCLFDHSAECIDRNSVADKVHRFPGHASRFMSQDYAALQGLVFELASKNNQQQQQQNRSMQAPPPNMGQGSQQNPVDITTPSLPQQQQLNNNIPSFAQQPAGSGIAPPPPPGPKRQPSSSGNNGPGSGQTNPQQQWQQQQLQQASGQGTPLQMQFSPNRTKPWASSDFSKDPFPVPEDKFLTYLSQMLGQPNMALPLVQNKAVDLYAFFNLVHKNGGSVKVCIPLTLRSSRDADVLYSSRATLPCGRKSLACSGLAKTPSLARPHARRPASPCR